MERGAIFRVANHRVQHWRGRQRGLGGDGDRTQEEPSPSCGDEGARRVLAWEDIYDQELA